MCSCLFADIPSLAVLGLGLALEEFLPIQECGFLECYLHCCPFPLSLSHPIFKDETYESSIALSFQIYQIILDYFYGLRFILVRILKSS